MPSQSNWGLTAPYQAYTFGDLGKVRDFQIAQAVAKGVANPSLAPQAMLAATEQGWTTSTDADEGGCSAADKLSVARLSPAALAVPEKAGDGKLCGGVSWQTL